MPRGGPALTEEILNGQDNIDVPDTLVSANDLTKVIAALKYGAKNFALQVKGVGATPTHWNVALQGSLDNTNWVSLVTHTDAGSQNADGDTTWATNKPVRYFRAILSSVTLGSATGIKVLILGLP